MGFMSPSNHRFHLNVTGICNLDCSHCYQENHSGKPIPLEQLQELLQRFQAFRKLKGDKGKGILTIGGGEPTTRRDLEEVFRLARRHRFTIRLVANATLLDLERARSLRRAGLRFAQVSLDGVTESSHEAIRGKHTWQRTMAGIMALRQAGIIVILSMVLLPDHNLQESHLLLDLSRSLRVWGVKYQRVIPRGHAALNLETRGEFHQAFVRILEHAAAIKYKRLLMLFDPLAHDLPNLYPELCRKILFLNTALCQCDRTEIIEVDGNGDVSFCRVGQKLGNLWEQDLASIWEHDMLQQIRGKTPQGGCHGCSAWSNCRGGCPAVTFGAYADIAAPDQACPKWARHPAR